MEHAFGATTSIGLADVRTLVQLIANRIERDDTSRDFEIHTKTITITTLHAASKVRLRFSSGTAVFACVFDPRPWADLDE